MYEENILSCIRRKKGKKCSKLSDAYKRTWQSKKDKEIELNYIYRQAVLLRGGSLVPPAKGCKFVERKRKGKKRKRGEKKTENTALRKKKGKEREEK